MAGQSHKHTKVNGSCKRTDTRDDCRIGSSHCRILGVMAMLPDLSNPLLFQALLARALETRVARKHNMATLLADEPVRLLQHRPELVTQNAIRAANYVIGH